MAKVSTVFFCNECGFESAKWLGQCPACKAWNSFSEAPKSYLDKSGLRKIPFGGEKENKTYTMSEVVVSENERISTGMEEFDRVLGGGIVSGSLILLGGDPGIGKSTILTQVCKNLSDSGHNILYVTGEESLSQIKLRANRLGRFSDNLRLFCETDLGIIESVIEKERPEIAIIDSIQTMYRPDAASAPGSIGQIRECTNVLLQLSKGLGTAIFVIGHVTKEGMVAGPRLLEHMVDTVLYFEGDNSASYRILRGVKNRFGSTNEIGVFEMCSSGLKEVKNPSEFMLSGRPEDASGTIVSCSIEGTRPILLEIQALVSKSALGNPRRSVTGFDYNRMNLLLAVLEKRVGMSFSECDAYVNIAGGIKINETALDLAVVLALASSFLDFVVDKDIIAIGEVGLSGEIRSVNMLNIRINEAKKLGFVRAIVPEMSVKALKELKDFELIGVRNVIEAIKAVKK